MQIVIKLTDYGNSVGPFNIRYNTAFTGPGTLTATNVSLDALIAGKQVFVDDFSYYVELENLDAYANGNRVKYYFVLPSPSLTPTVTPSVTPSISITPSVTPSISITPSVTASVTPSISITPSVTASVTASVTPSISITPSVTPSVTPSISITPSVTPSVTPSNTASVTPSISITPSVTASVTPSISITPSKTPSKTPSTTPSTSVPGVSFARSSATYTTTGLACLGSIGGTVFQSPFYGSVPTAGAQLYNESTLSTFWTPGSTSQYYLIQSQGAVKYAVLMNSNGTINSVTAC